MAEMLCVDVSEHNGTLDWAKIKKAGIDAAIIRTGYGVSHTDKQFYNNMDGAIAQGMKIGIYHFSYALNVDGAKNEAAFVIKLLKQYKDKITLPVYFDFEYDTVTYAQKQGVTLGKNAFNNHCVAFCEAIKAAGYKPGVYYNKDYYNTMVSLSSVGGYSQWYAQYASSPSISDYDLWQFSSTYTIAGCSGKFDMSEIKNSGTVTASKKYTVGWHKDSKGWWYADTANTYYKSRWAKINGKWYSFDKEGYMMSNTWQVEAGGDTYYLGADGDMQTNMIVGLGSDGKLQPIEPWYHLLSEVPAGYRAELDPLIEAGKLKGKSGEGENLVLDLPLSALRVLIILNRA
jgi:GH25 family lysozyme M1 (1,4-beta-N-acetylmuramidase)